MIKVKTCASIGGNEGRCMSTCLAEVGKQAGSLPKGPSAGCAEDEACLPCFDPLTGKPTGACTSLPCDKGPTKPPKTFPKCCGGIGTCIPLEQIPPRTRTSSAPTPAVRWPAALRTPSCRTT